MIKVMSWNVSFRNKRFEEGIAAMLFLKPDVICLQEVPMHRVDWLRRRLGMPYCITAKNYCLARAGIDTRLVLLSRLPVLDGKAMPHKRYRSLYNKLNGSKDGREYIQADIDVGNGQSVRVFNFHMPLKVGPSRRVNEIKHVLTQSADAPLKMLCGDFNTCGRFWVTPLLALPYSYGLRDIVFNEQKALEKLFAKHDIVNPYKGWRTQAQLPFQLDGIYVSQPLMGSTLVHKCTERWGSDHWPLMMHMKIPAIEQKKAAPIAI